MHHQSAASTSPAPCAPPRPAVISCQDVPDNLVFEFPYGVMCCCHLNQLLNTWVLLVLFFFGGGGGGSGAFCFCFLTGFCQIPKAGFKTEIYLPQVPEQLGLGPVSLGHEIFLFPWPSLDIGFNNWFLELEKG